MTNFRFTFAFEPQQQLQAAEAAAYFVLEVLYEARFFVSVEKCELVPTSRLVFLGIICDSKLCRFQAPEAKLDKLKAVLTDVIATRSSSFPMLEKVAGKCTTLSVAVPVAALYTHHMYKQIAVFQRTGGRNRNMEIGVPQNGGLMFELLRWLEVRGRFNVASWYRAEHQVISLTGASDASSSGWGGGDSKPRPESLQRRRRLSS